MKPSEFENPEYVFVCCAERDGGLESCGLRGRELHLALQTALEARPGGEEFHVVASACLGLCSQQTPVAFSVGVAGNQGWVGVDIGEARDIAEALIPQKGERVDVET